MVFDILIGMAYYTKLERDRKIKISKELNLSLEQAMKLYSTEITSSKRTVQDAIQIFKDNKCKTAEDVINYALNYQITNSLQGWVHLAGNKFRQGHQSMFTNLNLFSPRILRDNFSYYRYPNGDKIDDYINEIISIELLFSKFFSKGIKGKNRRRVVAMPVVTLMVPNDDEGAEEYQDSDNEFINTVLKDFSTYNNINVYRGLKLAMCCRLVVEKNNAVAVNSLGVTTKNDGNNAVGSIRVITVDLASIGFKHVGDKEGYCKELEYTLNLCEDILTAQRELIYKRDEEGFFNLSKVGWVDFKKMASTYGGVGMYEGIKLAFNQGYGTPYTEENLNFGNRILQIFNKKCIESTKDNGVTFNMEVSIPAESMAFRFAEREKFSFGDENVQFNEVSNQFTPLTIDFGITNKLKWEDILSKTVDPTGIAHINIEGNMNPDQNIRMHRAIWSAYPNIQHYAFNGTIFTCENGHDSLTNSGGYCSVCGGKIIDRVSRSIGYFKSVPFDFGPKRADEHSRRKWFDVNEIEKKLKEKS